MSPLTPLSLSGCTVSVRARRTTRPGRFAARVLALGLASLALQAANAAQGAAPTPESLPPAASRPFQDLATAGCSFDCAAPAGTEEHLPFTGLPAPATEPPAGAGVGHWLATAVDGGGTATAAGHRAAPPSGEPPMSRSGSLAMALVGLVLTVLGARHALGRRAARPGAAGRRPR